MSKYEAVLVMPNSPLGGCSRFSSCATRWLTSAGLASAAGWAAATGAALLVTTVAFSRVALGRHYPNDVLAGVALGVGWLALCRTALLYRGRAARRMLAA